MEPASIDPALPVFPLDGDPLNDPLNDLDLFDESLGFNMGPIDKVNFCLHYSTNFWYKILFLGIFKIIIHFWTW